MNRTDEKTLRPDSGNISGYDPFDEPLDTVFQDEEQLVLDDVFFEQARSAVTLDGMSFSYLKPPYVNFDNQNRAKKKIIECYNQHLLLLLYGYSGSGKSTLQEQFHDRYPDFTFRIDDFDELSPLELLIRIGEKVGIDLIRKGSQAKKLRDHLLSHPGYMLLFDNVSIKKPGDIDKLETLRKLNERAHVPIVISGVQKLYDDLYDDNKLPSTCNIVSRMDEFKLTGMTKKDAGMYLMTVSESENYTITYPAQQALITTALNETIGGINAFITILGRCITLARAKYYTSDGRSIPDKAKCVRPAVPDGKSYPGAEIVLILPPTTDPVVIDEDLVSRMLGEYKSHFPIICARKKKETTEFSS